MNLTRLIIPIALVAVSIAGGCDWLQQSKIVPETVPATVATTEEVMPAEPMEGLVRYEECSDANAETVLVLQTMVAGVFELSDEYGLRHYGPNDEQIVFDNSNFLGGGWSRYADGVSATGKGIGFGGGTRVELSDTAGLDLHISYSWDIDEGHGSIDQVVTVATIEPFDKQLTDRVRIVGRFRKPHPTTQPTEP